MIKRLIIFVVLFSIFSGTLAQEFFPFSEEEIKSLANKVKKLEKSNSLKTEMLFKYSQQVADLKEIIILDSLELNYKDKEIELYKNVIKKKELTWWEKIDEEIYFVLGFGLAMGASWMVKNVIEDK